MGGFSELTHQYFASPLQTARDPLASETERLAFDIILYRLGRRTGRAGDEVARCLRTSVDRMLDKHALVFNSMVGRLRVNGRSDLRQGFLDLSDELFQREEVRIDKANLTWFRNCCDPFLSGSNIYCLAFYG